MTISAQISEKGYNHLGPKALAVIGADTATRVIFCKQTHWIGYTKAKEVLGDLEDLLLHPMVHRMPCRLLLGATNNGKTAILNRFVGQHPGVENASGDGITVPVVAVEAPPKADESRLYGTILDRLFVPYRHSDNAGKREVLVKFHLEALRTRVLLIDEVHNLLSGSSQRHHEALNVIRNLTNTLRISIVAAGTRAAFNAIQTDPQVANRFIPVVLPRWEMGQDFERLLVSFERLLPLRLPSHLAQDEPLAMKLFSLMEGKIGELSSFLTTATIAAIESGHERIDTPLIQDLLRRGKWHPPSERKVLSDCLGD